MMNIENSLLILEEYWPLFWYGIKNTMTIAITATIIGLFIGLIIGAIRAIKKEDRDSIFTKLFKTTIHFLTSAYVEIIRGTPMMVQAMFLYHSLRTLLNWTPFVAGICIVSINTGAYMAEIIRSGIQSVDKGQTEGARSIGMSSFQTMIYVILPQAIKNSFPSIGNEFVVNIKDTSVLNVIAVTELFYQSTKIAGSLWNVTDTFLITAVIYFVLTFTTTRVLRLIEYKMNKTVSSYPASQTVEHNTLQTGGQK